MGLFTMVPRHMPARNCQPVNQPITFGCSASADTAAAAAAATDHSSRLSAAAASPAKRLLSELFVHHGEGRVEAALESVSGAMGARNSHG